MGYIIINKVAIYGFVIYREKMMKDKKNEVYEHIIKRHERRGKRAYYQKYVHFRLDIFFIQRIWIKRINGHANGP